MKKVTKEHFSSTVLKLDVVLTHSEKFPYTTEFKTRSGKLMGKEIDRYGVGDEDRIVEEFYTDLV